MFRCKLCEEYENKGPNEATLKAIEEIRNGKVKTYKNVKEMLRELNMDSTR